jgi:hypothetical protein
MPACMPWRSRRRRPANEVQRDGQESGPISLMASARHCRPGGQPAFSAGQEAARRLLEGPQRYTCLAGGTRSGKTFLIVRMILIRALQAKGSRHAILRHHANAARASIALGTLPQVVQLCFPGMRLKEHRQDGYFALPNDSRVWIGGLDDKDASRKSSGSNIPLCS